MLDLILLWDKFYVYKYKWQETAQVLMLFSESWTVGMVCGKITTRDCRQMKDGHNVER